MSISISKVTTVLHRFALLFGVPTQFVGIDSSDVAGVWAGLLSEYDESQFNTAARHLAKTLKRFPVPADFIEIMDAATKGAGAEVGK